MRTIVLGMTSVVLFGLMVGQVRANESAEAGVDVVGVQVAVTGFDYEEKWNRYKEMPFNAQRPGIEVAFAVSHPAGGILEMDDQQSSLDLFVDDHGTDLLAEKTKAAFGNKAGFGPFQKISKDGKGMLFSVRSPTLPAKGTRVVTAAGTIAFITGATQTTVEAKGVELTKGTALRLGEFDFEICEVGKPDWGDEPMAVTFKASNALDGLIGFSFHAADGTEIESKKGGGTTMRFGSMVTVEKTYKFTTTVTDPVTMRMTYWADLEHVKVPFRVETGLMP